MKECLRGRLEKAEQEGTPFQSAGSFIDHLHKDRSLNDVCKIWIDDAPHRELRELWNDHQARLGRFQSSASHAPVLNTGMGGPSVPYRSNVPDSAYGPSPGSPMSDQRDSSVSRIPETEVLSLY